MPSRHTLRILTAATASILLYSATAAQTPVVAGRVPADLAAIISVTDSQSAWTEFNRSRFGQQLLAIASAPLVQDTLLQQQLRAAEGQLGFPLTMTSIMTERVEGFDVYLIDRRGKTELAINFRLRNAADAETLFQTLSAEAASATGVARGVPAATVEEADMAGFRTLFLPAFDMYFARQGNVLLYATERSTLESAMGNIGGPFLQTQLFRNFFEGLGDSPGQLWYWGALAKLGNLLGETTTGNPSTALNFVDGTAGRIHLERGLIRQTSFSPLAQLQPVQRRYVLAAPPPGSLSAIALHPPEALMAYASNHFDGVSLFDIVMASTEEATGSADARALVDTQLDMARQTLGFDPRTDLLANLGPDLGLSFKEGDGDFPAAFLLTAGLRDRARVELVLGFLEDLFTPPPPRALPDGTMPPPQPSPVVTVQHAGAEIFFVDGTPLAWTISTDNKLFVAESAASIKAALNRNSRGGQTLAANADFQRIVAQHPSSVNDFLVFSVAKIVEAVAPAAVGFGLELGDLETLLQNLDHVAVSQVFGTTGSLSTTTLNVR